MRLIKYPTEAEWEELLKRPTMNMDTLYATVSTIMEEVRNGGDKALYELESKFDKVSLSTLAVTPQEIEEAGDSVDDRLKEAVNQAKHNIAAFHAAQRPKTKKVETMPGVTCWQQARAIEKVGLYVPGGSAPLFSTVLMLAVPAVIAGCKEVVICTPPNKEGKVHPAILYAAGLSGVKKVYKVGGAQAIAAMTYGTESVPKVYKIFGPGNQYVMAAKQLASMRGVAIDMPAGPSEVLVIADKYANPVFVAADLLSQAEHGPDSQVILVTTSMDVLRQTAAETERQLQSLPRKDIAASALGHSRLILVRSEREAVGFSNAYAPEHLIIQTRNYRKTAKGIVNAGSVFLGPLSTESAGDYASGTNHTLPTCGYARMYGGVCLDSFLRKVTFQEISPSGLRAIGQTVELMAQAECLEAHKRAMTVRLESLKQ